MMFPNVKKNSLTKKILSVSLIGCITVTIMAAAMQPFLVYASVGSGTLRGVLIGLSALMGTGNVNAATINTLNSSAYVSDLSAYSSANMTEAQLNSLLTADTGLARWTAPLANNTQQVSLAQEYVSAAGGDPSGLQGLGAASAAKNIQASIDYYLEHGELKPSFGGQTITDNIMGTAVMQSMADVAYNFDNVMWYARENGWTDAQIDSLFDSGAAFGDLQNAIDYIEDLDKTITGGIKVNDIQSVIDQVPVGGSLGWTGANANNRYYYYGRKDTLFGKYFNTGNNLYTRVILCKESGNISNTWMYNGTSHPSSVQIYSINTNYGSFYGKQDLGSTNNLAADNFILFDSLDSMYQAFSNYNTKSPDIITGDGQAEGTWTQDSNLNNRNQFNLNVTINYDPNYNYIVPDDTTINNYITNVQDDINNQEDQQTIGQELLKLIEEMKQATPQPTEAPQTTVIPPQPTEAPKPTNTPEQNQQNTTGMATPELAEKFPFCIPFDLFTMMSHFTANRSAPYIDVELDLGPAGVHHIELDFSVWDSVAALLRLLELIVFIAGLALAARRLIGAWG